MSKQLRIAQVAPLWIPVPPRTYGGIELMLSLLTEELVAREHKVTLFASGDAKTKAELVAPTSTGLWLRKVRSPHAVIEVLLKEVHNRRHDFDLIHNHADFFMFPLAIMDDGTPILTTLHRPIDDAEAQAIKAYPNKYFCAISEDQKKSAQDRGIEITGVVHNGINISQYKFSNWPDDYFMYLGRLNEEKGVVDAIEVAKRAQVPLVVAGNIVGGDEWNYFFHKVQPELNSEHIRFVGQVDFNEKVRLLRGARGLLFPIHRREPFGLVMIEAMACGTPVIAYGRGSVHEVVKDNETGFIVNSKEEMIDTILHKAHKIKRADCRDHVEKNFTLQKMVDTYEGIYEKILSE